MPDVADLTPQEREALLARFSSDHSPWMQLYRRLTETLGYRPARQALETMLAEFRSQNIYVPEPANFYQRLQREALYEDIRRRFKGNNFDELRAETGLSDRQLRYIIHGRPSRAGES